MGFEHISPVGDYAYYHITTTQTSTPVGALVGTTSSTAVAAPGSVTVTTAVNGAANISVGQVLNIFGGTGTAEQVPVTAVNAAANQFTATFANTHSGTYSISSINRGTYLGTLIVGAPGSAITITLSDGYPGWTGAQTVAVVTPSAGMVIPFNLELKHGLYVTVAGTTAGDYTITYQNAYRQN